MWLVSGDQAYDLSFGLIGLLVLDVFTGWINFCDLFLQGDHKCDSDNVGPNQD